MLVSETCDIFEALALDPRDHFETSTPKTRNSDDADTGPYLDKYDEFILETDHTAGFARIAKAVSRAVIQNWHIARRATPTTCINPRAHEIFETQMISSRPNRNSRSRERQKSFTQLELHLSNDTGSANPALSHVPPRWNLRDITTTMTDFILSNKTFSREAYELNQRKERERERAKVERANIISSVGFLGGHESSRVQTDPLHQNGFTSIKRLPATPRTQSVILTPPMTPKPQEGPRMNSVNSAVDFTKPPANGMDYDRLFYPSPLRLCSPSPLRKDNARLTPPYSHPLPKLSYNPPAVLQRQNIKRKPLAIPKLPKNPLAVSPLQNPDKPSPGLSIPATKAPVAGTIELPSTRFTLNSPRILHGPIRIERQQQQYFSPEDESLDWMAFQISIIGVLDEYGNGKDDGFCRTGEVELDDLASWFSDFGLAVGSMEKEGPDGWIKAYV